MAMSVEQQQHCDNYPQKATIVKEWVVSSLHSWITEGKKDSRRLLASSLTRPFFSSSLCDIRKKELREGGEMAFHRKVGRKDVALKREECMRKGWPGLFTTVKQWESCKAKPCLFCDFTKASELGFVPKYHGNYPGINGLTFMLWPWQSFLLGLYQHISGLSAIKSLNEKSGRIYPKEKGERGLHTTREKRPGLLG